MDRLEAYCWLLGWLDWADPASPEWRQAVKDLHNLEGCLTDAEYRGFRQQYKKRRKVIRKEIVSIRCLPDPRPG